MGLIPQIKEVRSQNDANFAGVFLRLSAAISFDLKSSLQLSVLVDRRLQRWQTPLSHWTNEACFFSRRRQILLKST